MLASIKNIRLANLVPGYDIREQEIDLSILDQHWRKNCGSTFVAQHHVTLSYTTLKLIQMKRLFPIVLTRNLPDAMMSAVDHHRKVDQNMEKSLMPVQFNDWPLAKRLDYVIAFRIPWYLKFFKSWSTRLPNFSSHWFKYEDLANRPADYLTEILKPLNIRLSVEQIEAVLNQSRNQATKFNKGVNGRGREALSDEQHQRISEMVELYEIPLAYRDYLLGQAIL